VPLTERDPELEPGEVRAKAAVDAPAEGDVAIGLAVEANLVGIVEELLVVFAEPISAMTWSPFAIGQPPISASATAARTMP